MRTKSARDSPVKSFTRGDLPSATVPTAMPGGNILPSAVVTIRAPAVMRDPGGRYSSTSVTVLYRYGDCVPRFGVDAWRNPVPVGRCRRAETSRPLSMRRSALA